MWLNSSRLHQQAFSRWSTFNRAGISPDTCSRTQLSVLWPRIINPPLTIVNRHTEWTRSPLSGSTLCARANLRNASEKLVLLTQWLYSVNSYSQSTPTWRHFFVRFSCLQTIVAISQRWSVWLNFSPGWPTTGRLLLIGRLANEYTDAHWILSIPICTSSICTRQSGHVMLHTRHCSIWYQV